MLKLRNARDELIKRYLMEMQGVPDYKADICAAFAQGNVGRAILLANSEHFNEIREEAVRLLKYVHEMELDEVVEAVRRIGVYKIEINDYLDIIMIWYRDVLLYKATQEPDKVVFKDQISAIKKQASQSSYEGVERILESLEKAKARLRANVNFDLVMELLFLTIKEN
jgi:DNA polymerase-3 subunit delta'